MLQVKADRKLVDAFGTDVYAIGGRVRDGLRDHFNGTQTIHKDYDYIVTGLSFDEAKERLLRLGRIDEVGAHFAVFKIDVDGVTIDVALPRVEISTGTGHNDFSAHFGKDVSLRDDMYRRDFTMNAVSVQLASGMLFSVENAVDDIRDDYLRVINEKAFQDDPLRLWRGVQFTARFGLTVDPHTRVLMEKNASLANTCAAERIRDEIDKLLTKSERPSIGLELARETGILRTAIPELELGFGMEQNMHHAFDVWGHLLEATDFTRATKHDRLAALFHDVGKPVTRDMKPSSHGGYTFHGHEREGAHMTRAILGRLRYNNEDVETTTSLVDNHMYVADPSISRGQMLRFIRRVGEENLDRQFALRHADIMGCGVPKYQNMMMNQEFEAKIRELVLEEPVLSVKDLAINGRDVISGLIESGVVPENYRRGPEVGVVLRQLLEDVTDRPELNSVEALSVRIVPIARSAEKMKKIEMPSRLAMKAI